MWWARRAPAHGNANSTDSTDRGGTQAAADPGVPGMRHVLRRAPLAFSQGPLAAQAQGLPTRLLLQLLSPADQPRGKKRAGVAARKSHCQRNQLLSQSPAARSLAENCSRRNFEAKTGASRLDATRVERGMFLRTRSLLGRHPYL